MQSWKPARTLLQRFSPLDELGPGSLAMLESHAEVFSRSLGEPVFQEDSSQRWVCYLLSGTVELRVEGELTDVVQADSPRARFPLQHENTRNYTTRVISPRAECLRFDARILDKILTWDQTGSYIVSELSPAGQDERTAGDWMVRLLQAPLLHKLPPAHLQSLFSKMMPVEYEAGDTIITQGTQPDYFYIVATGTCRVTRQSPIANHHVVLADLGPGDMFGEDALVGETRRNATVVMRTAGTLMRLGKTDFDKLCKQPAIRQINQIEAERMMACGAQVIDVRFSSEAKPDGPVGAVNIPLHTLRQHIPLLRDTPIIACCDSGQRSSVAAFILAEHGFDAYVLSRTVDIL